MRDAKQANTRVVVRLGVTAVLMFGFGFALVPLYEVFCDITGLNGKNFGRGDVAALEVDRSRTVKVQFVSTNPETMPWEFKPVERSMRIFPGETHQTAYFAANPTSHWMVAQAVPSVTPAEAAQYLTKINCFCFDRQPLDAGASQEMPMVFVVSPELPAHISTITVSYALYDITASEPVALQDKTKTGSQLL
ncbi:MAG: cytochrome c oxidase assembly protein [Litorivicinaceae bacterium]|mgnify:CR=1 FL=1|jgi:cytochrome c oxidase assembly protein subunit 11|nr:cytochrome c oxidase assembly protein [Litorivicinaceae bacterium]MDP5329168.1 cytochrome c oxidase assembly protein [Litorivicinaceae bacterium]MDP5330055.1 cytochrome c oxidase assembly protein [Litorivicinaceae bacterium]MDP5342462.1 cytochrome c oxidase assembly protein [Litorivicinaceae bacterium]MDP5343900.1 cytochrome c oxidase assembly protein [Litorivicinaceae bacterium]